MTVRVASTRKLDVILALKFCYELYDNQYKLVTWPLRLSTTHTIRTTVAVVSKLRHPPYHWVGSRNSSLRGCEEKNGNLVTKSEVVEFIENLCVTTTPLSHCVTTTTLSHCVTTTPLSHCITTTPLSHSKSPIRNGSLISLHWTSRSSGKHSCFVCGRSRV
jgi:hypothetical protein